MNVKKNGVDLARKSSYNAGDPRIRPFIEDRMVQEKVAHIEHLATNESQYPPSPKVIAALTEAIHHVNLYPDPSSTVLRRALAKKFNISEKMVTVGNGADELLYMVGKAFIEDGENAVLSTPCYPTEIRGIESMGGEIRHIAYRSDFTCDIEAVLAGIDAKTKIVMLCTPGNPNTKVIPQKELEWFMERVPEHILVVMDEAYKEFINLNDAADPMQYFTEDRNILFLRTFSKFYGLAGLRVGFAIGPEHIIDVLRRSLPAFPVNTLAQVAALAAMEDGEYYDTVFKTMVEDRDYLTQGLLEAGMKPVFPSQTNFLFVDACDVPIDVLDRTLFSKGIYIRAGGYNPYNTHVRITVGNLQQNKRIIAIVKELCEKYKK